MCLLSLAVSIVYTLECMSRLDVISSPAQPGFHRPQKLSADLLSVEARLVGYRSPNQNLDRIFSPEPYATAKQWHTVRVKNAS
jgi:hypothetical protein